MTTKETFLHKLAFEGKGAALGWLQSQVVIRALKHESSLEFFQRADVRQWMLEIRTRSPACRVT